MQLIFPLFLSLFLFFPLHASNEYAYSDEQEELQQKVLYLNYESLPKRLIKGEKFTITYKVLSTDTSFDDLVYKFDNYYGLERLNKEPIRKIKDYYYFDTFEFIATNEMLKTPDVTLFLQFNGYYKSNPTTLKGETIPVISLNSDKRFSNIIADSFILKKYKTTSYDNKSNVIVFNASAKNCNLQSIKFQNIDKQGIESFDINKTVSTITYYMVVNKNLDTFEFTYYNLKENKFKSVIIPIIVDDDSVSTQSDLKPTQNKQKIIKLIIASALLFLAILAFILFRKYSLLLLIVPSIIYIVYNFIPLETICAKKGADLLLLPMDGGTIMTQLERRENFEVLNSVGEFYKIKYNNKIGWINSENICKH